MASYQLQISTLLKKILKPIIRIAPRHLENDEKRRRLLVIFGALVAIPALVYFTFNDFVLKDTVGVFMDGGLSILLIVSLAFLSRVKNGIWIYRISILGMTTVFLYNVIAGPSGQSSVLWLYIYPLIVFYVLGAKEGTYWFAFTFIISSASILMPEFLGTHNYPFDLRIRYFISIIMVTVISFALEFLREYFYTKLEIQSAELKEALDKIRTLDGLIPICSICKKIRDDKGYWNRLEEYLTEHTNALLSHGICDDCCKKNHPEAYARYAAKKKASGS